MNVAISASSQGTLNQGGFNKRRASDDESELQAESKRSRYSWYFTLEQESDASSEDDESIYTAQGYETEFARDTSDTSTHTWVSESDFEERDIPLLEYEIHSSSDSNQLFNSLSSSSEPENIVAVEFITFCDSDGMADDSDVSRCSTDAEARVSAFKICVQCKNPNNNSLYQYCRKCFQERKTYFPRPRRKPRSTSNSSKKSDRTTTTVTSNSQEFSEVDSGIGSSQCEMESTTTATSNSQELSEMDFGIHSSQCEIDSVIASGQELSLRNSGDVSSTFDSQASEAPIISSQASDALVSQKSEPLMFISQSCEVSMLESQNSEPILPVSRNSEFLNTTTLTSMASNQETTDEVDSSVMSKDVPSSSQDSVTNEKHNDEEEVAEISIRSLLKRLQKLEKAGSASSMLCITCFENKRDSVFNHGKTGHQCCCYKCAKKVCMSNGNRCPICKRRVSTITKIFLD